MTRDTKESKRPIRCAIYTRKSSDEGLDQDFNSLDAQREAGEAFIASQRAEGWTCLPTRYDDGGFSGGSLDRPAVKRLLEDIEEFSIRMQFHMARWNYEPFEKAMVSFGLTRRSSSFVSYNNFVMSVRRLKRRRPKMRPKAQKHQMLNQLLSVVGTRKNNSSMFDGNVKLK
jgi:hypothetical protein